MGVTIAADDDPRRSVVREWLKDNPNPTGRVLAEAGYVVPHWPRPYGLDADPLLQAIIDEELERGRNPSALQPDRDRMGRSNAASCRFRGAKATTPVTDARR